MKMKMFLRIKCRSEEECIELFERLNIKGFKWNDGSPLSAEDTDWNHKDNTNNFIGYELWDDKTITRFFTMEEEESYNGVFLISYEDSKKYNLETILYHFIQGKDLGLIASKGKKLSFWEAGKRICESSNLAMRLKSWKEDVYIKMQVPDEYSKMTHPYLYVTSRFGKVPWKETFVEMFSEDWEVVEREE